VPPPRLSHGREKFIGDAKGALKETVTVEIKWEKNVKGASVPKEVRAHAVVLVPAYN